MIPCWRWSHFLCNTIKVFSLNTVTKCSTIIYHFRCAVWFQGYIKTALKISGLMENKTGKRFMDDQEKWIRNVGKWKNYTEVIYSRSKRDGCRDMYVFLLFNFELGKLNKTFAHYEGRQVHLFYDFYYKKSGGIFINIPFY